MADETDDPRLPTTASSSAVSLEWAHRWNIRNFRAQLAGERDEARRATLTTLLAEEERKLERLLRAKPAAPQS